MPQIGKELNANFIIEGSVELQNEDISIYVQIIEAKNDRHIWAHDFKGKWNELLAIRANIAKAVASNLKIILTQEEIKMIETKPTENLEAYNYYLRGNVFYSKSFEKRDWINALNMYNKAIELDPTFALPYTMKTRTYLKIYWYHIDRSGTPLEKAREAVETALKINPESGEAYLAYGVYYYQGFLNYAKALKYFRKAQEYLSDDAECFMYIAAVYRRMGDFAQAEKYFLEAIKLAPNSREINFDIALTYYILRDYAVTLKYLNKTLEINPALANAHNRKIDVYLNKDENTVNAKLAMEESSLILNISHYPDLILKVLILYLYDGNYHDAIDYLNATNFEGLKDPHYYHPKDLYYAYTYDLQNNTEKAIHHYDLSRRQIEEKLQEYPEDSRLYSSLGICYAGLNQKEKAIQSGKKAVEILPLEKEAWRGYNRLLELAQIYVMTEEYDLAFEQLEILLSHPGELSVNRLQNDFIWKPLWGLDEFYKLLRKYSD